MLEYTMCILFVYIVNLSCLWFECSVHVSDGFPKQSLDGGGLVGWALSKFILDFWNLFNFAKPLTDLLKI